MHFELSGEHETLQDASPGAGELFFHQLSGDRLPGPVLSWRRKDLDVQMLRAPAMTHRIIEVLAVSDARLEALCESVGLLNLPLRNIWSGLTIKDASPGADAVEHEVGRVLFQKGYRADLKDPEMVLRPSSRQER